MRRAFVLVLLMCQCVLAAPLADRVPADAVVYVGWQGAGAAGGAAYEGSRLKEIVGISDLAQMRDFFGRVAAKVGKKDQSLTEIMGALTPVADVVWGSPTALYVGPGGNGFRAALIIHAGPAAEQVKAKLQQVLAKQKKRDVTAVAVGEFVVVGTLDEGLTNLVAGRAAGQAALANSPDFIAATGKVQKDAAITMFVSVDALRAQMDKAAWKEWQTWSDALNLKGVRYGVHTAGFDGKDWSGQTFIAAPAPRQGIAALFDQQPISDELLRVIPRNATLVMAGQCDAARLLKETRAALAKGDPRAASNFGGALNAAKAMTNVDIETGLLQSLGSEWAMYAAPEVGGSRAMGWVFANRLRNAAAAETALTNVGNALSNAATSSMRQGGMQLSAYSVQYGDLTVHYLGVIGIAPAWTIKNGILYMGFYPQTVVAAAEAASGKESILDNPIIAQARKQAPAAGIQFVDLPATAADGYGTALLLSRYALGFADMTGVQSPMLVMPPLHKLKPLLSPSLTVSWVDDAGWYKRGGEPFPGSMILSGDYSLGMVFQPSILAAVILPQFTSASEEAKMSATMSTVQSVRAQMELYKLQHLDAAPDFEQYPNWEQMTQRTSEDGVPGPVGKYGPYLMVPPTNPLNGSSRVEVVDGPVEEGDSASEVGVGWVMDKSSKRMYATDKEYMIMIQP